MRLYAKEQSMHLLTEQVVDCGHRPQHENYSVAVFVNMKGSRPKKNPQPVLQFYISRETFCYSFYDCGHFWYIQARLSIEMVM